MQPARHQQGGSHRHAQQKLKKNTEANTVHISRRLRGRRLRIQQPLRTIASPPGQKKNRESVDALPRAEHALPAAGGKGPAHPAETEIARRRKTRGCAPARNRQILLPAPAPQDGRRMKQQHARQNGGQPQKRQSLHHPQPSQMPGFRPPEKQGGQQQERDAPAGASRAGKTKAPPVPCTK